MSLIVQDNEDYTIIRDPRGRIVYVTASATAKLPTTEFPSGTLAWIPSEGKFYLLSSGSWSIFSFSQANSTLSGTLSVGGVLTATGGVVGALTGNVIGDVTGDLTGDIVTSTQATGITPFVNVEEIDLGGADELAPVNSAANMIPANSVVFGVQKYVTETFAGDVTNYDIGDETTATRFVTNNTQLTATNTDFHNEDGIVLDLAASDIEILLDNAATAGKLRIAVYGFTFNPPTS